MAETGRLAAWMGLGKGFEIREYPVPDPKPGALARQGRDRERLRLRHALLEGRAGHGEAGAEAPAEYRPRAHGHGLPPRRRRDDRLGGPAAPRGRPRHLPLLPALRALPRLPSPPVQVVPHAPVELERVLRRVAALPGGLRRLLLPRAQSRDLPHPRRDHRRDGRGHQLRVHPGVRGPRDRGVQGGPDGRDPGRGRPRRLRVRGRPRDGRRPDHRDRRRRGAARARQGLRRRRDGRPPRVPDARERGSSACWSSRSGGGPTW